MADVRTCQDKSHLLILLCTLTYTSTQYPSPLEEGDGEELDCGISMNLSAALHQTILPVKGKKHEGKSPPLPPPHHTHTHTHTHTLTCIQVT